MKLVNEITTFCSQLRRIAVDLDNAVASCCSFLSISTWNGRKLSYFFCNFCEQTKTLFLAINLPK